MATLLVMTDTRCLRYPTDISVWIASAGLAHVTETHKDNRLGTHLQFVFHLAAEYRMGGTELSLAAVHYSNSKNRFGWNGPNTRQNFATLQLGRESWIQEEGI